MTLVMIHGSLARSCILFSLAAGLYGLWLYLRKQGVSSNYWGVLIIGEVLYVAQAAIGVALYLVGGAPGRIVHFLYGVLLILVLPSAYAYSRGRDGRREVLIYALLSLFLTGVSIRAIITAG